MQTFWQTTPGLCVRIPTGYWIQWNGGFRHQLYLQTPWTSCDWLCYLIWNGTSREEYETIDSDSGHREYTCRQQGSYVTHNGIAFHNADLLDRDEKSNVILKIMTTESEWSNGVYERKMLWYCWNTCAMKLVVPWAIAWCFMYMDFYRIHLFSGYIWIFPATHFDKLPTHNMSSICNLSRII